MSERITSEAQIDVLLTQLDAAGFEGAMFERCRGGRAFRIDARAEDIASMLENLRTKDAEIARLRRGLEGVKDWAARSSAPGLEQWCAEALSPTGALAVFPVPQIELSPRMTAERLNEWRGMTPEEVMREVERARASEDQKGATIKALADALVSAAPVTDDDGPCWCVGVDKKNGRHYDLECLSRRAALRLAGRIP